MNESKQQEEDREEIFRFRKQGETLRFHGGREGKIIKKTDCYMLIKMQEGYTNILFKDKINFN